MCFHVEGRVDLHTRAEERVRVVDDVGVLEARARKPEKTGFKFKLSVLVLMEGANHS